MELFTPHGLTDSPMQKATLEWQSFLDQYDTDRTLMKENNHNESGIPLSYHYTYGCYTWEMVEKLDEIVQKHGLKLLDKYTVAQRYQKDIMYEALGIDGVVRTDAGAKVEESAGECYPNGNFESSLTFTMTRKDAAWTASCFAEFEYAKKDTFRPIVSGLVAGDFEQWNYTAADGTALLLVLRKDGQGQIFADAGDATIFITITPDIPGVYPRDESEIPTKKALEQMADLFDYQVSPKTFVIDEVQSKLDASEAEYEAQHAFVMPEYHSYGEYLNAQPGVDRLSYCFFDYDGDGRSELLTSYDGESIFAVVYFREGLVDEFLLGGHHRICEGGILEGYDDFDFTTFVRHVYYKAGDVNGRPSYHHEQLRFAEGVEQEQGLWYRLTEPMSPVEEYPVCSDEEARAIMDKYPPLDMGWKSVLEFQMEDGTTLNQYIRANDPVVTEEDRIRLYEEFALRRAEIDNFAYYGFRDVNGDGKLDVLLSVGPDGPFLTATEERGKISKITSWYVYLSEGNVVYSIDTQMGEGEYYLDEYELYEFRRIEGTKLIPLACVRHNLSIDTWYADLDGPEITEAEAQAIISKYPPIKLDLKPISDIQK